MSIWDRTMTNQEWKAMKQVEIEHGKDITVRMNPQTFRIEYYNVKTGKVVSSHI